MKTITIKNPQNDIFPVNFDTYQDLLACLIEQFETSTFLIQTDEAELTKVEKEAYQKHKKDGYDDFIDFQG